MKQQIFRWLEREQKKYHEISRKEKYMVLDRTEKIVLDKNLMNENEIWISGHKIIYMYI